MRVTVPPSELALVSSSSVALVAAPSVVWANTQMLSIPMIRLRDPF